MTTLSALPAVQAQPTQQITPKAFQRITSNSDSVLFSGRNANKTPKRSGLMTRLAPLAIAALALAGCSTAASSETSVPSEPAPTAVVVEDTPAVTQTPVVEDAAPEIEVEIGDAVSIDRDDVPADSDGEVAPVVEESEEAYSANTLCNDVAAEAEELRCVLSEAFPPDVRNNPEEFEFLIEGYTLGIFTKTDLAFLIQESADENDRVIDYRDYEFFEGVDIGDHVTLEEVHEDFNDPNN